jgi:ABC-type enterochelin transport system substrate-binding protein
MSADVEAENRALHTVIAQLRASVEEKITQHRRIWGRESDAEVLIHGIQSDLARASRRASQVARGGE